MSDLCKELVGPWDVRQPETQVLQNLLLTFIMAPLHGNDNSAVDFEFVPQRQVHDDASKCPRRGGATGACETSSVRCTR